LIPPDPIRVKGLGNFAKLNKKSIGHYLKSTDLVVKQKTTFKTLCANRSSLPAQRNRPHVWKIEQRYSERK
jgi:hypothetical protein